MYYKQSRVWVNALVVAGTACFAIAVAAGSVTLFIVGTAAFIAGVAVHRKYGICPECKRHIPPTLGYNNCPHCGEYLL